MTAPDLYPIAEQLLTGVGAAHAAGIIHRDLKPDNVFLVRQPDGKDFVKILDFGISKFGTQSGPGGKELSLTRTGALMGTPFYLAPEQANGSKSIDQRTDLYTVGVILYECIAGVVPHAADTFNQLLFRIVLEPPPPILERVPSADPNFVALIERAMAKEPKLRFQSADEMSQALAAWAQGAPLSRSLSPPDASGRHSANPALARNSTPGPNSRGGTSARDSATLASQPGRDLAHQTVDPWSQSKASNPLYTDDAPGLRPSKLPWVVAGFAGLALVLVAFVLLKRGSGNDQPALDTPSSVTAVQIAPPEELTPPPAKTALEPAVAPAPNPAPSASDAPEPNAPPAVTRGSAARPLTRNKSGSRSAPAAAEPEPTPAPIAVPAPAPAPAPMPPAAAPAAVPAPATTADVSRTRGGRAIRGDL
jgi:serine/threonine-protein kinase